MKKHSHDIDDDRLRLARQMTPYPTLLDEIVDISRQEFGWFTKQLTRCFEYPWVCHTIGADLAGRKILDVGTGVSPVPFLLSKRGAKVVTIDYSDLVRVLENKANWNEWGFLDYSMIDPKIMSYNMSILDFQPKKTNSFDVVYSISVIEHMSSTVRRRFLLKACSLLRRNGKLVLTIDIEHSSNNLWNRDRGQTVEESTLHGTLMDLEGEITKSGFELKRIEVIRRFFPKLGDLAFLFAVKKNFLG